MNVEIIDAGIKIAAGGLASAVFCMAWVYRLRSSGAFMTESGRKKRELLEEVADYVSGVHHVYKQYIVLTQEFARAGEYWPKTRRDELKKISERLADEFRNLSKAESKLLLLGEKRLERGLRAYGSKIVSMRRVVYPEKGSMTAQDLVSLEEFKREISRLKEAFFESLSDRYSGKVYAA